MNPKITNALSWIVTLIVPFFIIMMVIRLLFTPLYPQVVYRLPGFPADYYGFTLEERLHWSQLSIEYLRNDAGIAFLGDERLADGQPLYNQRELSHMVDVKTVFQDMLTAFAVLRVLLVVLGVWAWRGGWLAEFVRGLGRGGLLTIGLVIFILAAVAISFNWLFTQFHQLFFASGTWLFSYSDTLIRLFPLPFWQIGFVLVGLFTLVFAAALVLIDRGWRARAAG
jgi:integral membrane protein (TIGR01906 family)